VWDIFQSRGIRHLPVINAENVLVGIVTQRDLYRLVSPRKTMEGNMVYDKNELDEFILEHVITKGVATLNQDQTLSSAIDLMVNKRYGCIPIVDDRGRLIGIITQTDVLRAIASYFI